MDTLKNKLISLLGDSANDYMLHSEGTMSNDLLFSFVVHVADVEAAIRRSPEKIHVLFGSRLGDVGRTSCERFLAYRVAKAGLAMLAAGLRKEGFKVKYLEIPHTDTEMWPGGQSVGKTCEWIVSQL